MAADRPTGVEDLANIAGIEYLLIDAETSLRDIKKALKRNELSYPGAAAISPALLVW